MRGRKKRRVQGFEFYSQFRYLYIKRRNRNLRRDTWSWLDHKQSSRIIITITKDVQIGLSNEIYSTDWTLDRLLMKYGCMREEKWDYWQKTKGSELPFAVRRAVAHAKKPKLLYHEYTAGKIKSQIIKDIFYSLTFLTNHLRLIWLVLFRQL